MMHSGRPSAESDSTPPERPPIVNLRPPTTGPAGPQTRASADAHEGEAKYRALFDAIDEGFCIIEVEFEAGRAVDYRFLEANPAFERHTGLTDAVGRRVRELIPGHDAHWFETYGRVATTGEATRFQNFAAALGRHFDVYAFRVGTPDQRRVAILFTDTTDRTRAEARQTFLLKLSDALRPLSDPVEVQSAAARLLGEHLGVARAFYLEADAEGDGFTIHRDAVTGVPSIAGRHRASQYDRRVRDRWLAGQIAASADVARDDLSPDQRAATAAIQVRAWLGVPLVKAGRLVAALVVHRSEPHAWTPDETALVAETAERTWAAVEQARAEAALRDSRRRLQLALAAARTGIWTWDVAADRQTRDGNLNRLLGLPPVETTQSIEDFFARIHPADRAQVRAAFEATARLGPELTAEFRVVWPDGTVRWLRDQGDAFGGTGGPYLTGAAIDVTDRRSAEDRFRAVAANLPNAAAFVVDRDLRYVLAEGEAFRAAGFEPTDLEGKTVHQALPPDLAADYAVRYRQVLAGQPFRIEHESHGRHYVTHGVPLRAADEPPYAVLAVSYDITDRKQAEAAVRAGEHRLRQIVGSVTDYAIFTLDADRRVTLWNAGAEAIFGYQQAEIAGRSADVVFTPEDRAAGAPAAEAATARATGRAADERWHMRKDGSRFFASGVLTRLGPGAADGFVKVARDLTDRKRMEDDLRDARDRLEEKVAERTAELVAALEALEAEMGRRRELGRRLVTAQEEERRRVARDLHDSVGQLLAGLALAVKAVELAGDLPPGPADRLLDVQRIADTLGREVHGLAVRLRPTSLDDIGLEAALAQLVGEWAARTGVRADVHVAGLGPGRLPDEIATAVYRIVQEALTNVARHARATVASVVVRRAAGAVTALIEDNGVGFEPAAATGRLGLLGMRERAALVGGDMEVESGPGAGTTVFVRIPVRGDPEGAA